MQDPRLLGVAFAALMLPVLLDSIENHHFMTMVHSLQAGCRCRQSTRAIPLSNNNNRRDTP
jgi:hypothetical protein